MRCTYFRCNEKVIHDLLNLRKNEYFSISHYNIHTKAYGPIIDIIRGGERTKVDLTLHDFEHAFATVLPVGVFFGGIWQEFKDFMTGTYIIIVHGSGLPEWTEKPEGMAMYESNPILNEHGKIEMFEPVYNDSKHNLG